ncbi:hypothetical protein XELAEV_18023342mg, partial [Xenopus laevis]
GAHQGHSVCDVEIQRNEIRKMLIKQQDRLQEREQYKLKSDKRLVEEKVSQLKDEVRQQYDKLHQILDKDLRKTMDILDKAQAKFCNENAAQVLHLNERMQEAKKLLSSVQVMFDKTEDINFLKNRKSVKILMATGGSLPPPKIGHLNSKLFLNEIAKKEKQLRKMLEGPFNTPVPFLQSIPMYSCKGNFLDSASRTVCGLYISQGSSSESVLSQYGGRKILVCSVDNCYCSSVSNHSGHQPYPRSGHFLWTVSSQECSHPLPPTPSVTQSLPGLVVREWIIASKQHGCQDFYRVNGQPATKHYVTS